MNDTKMEITLSAKEIKALQSRVIELEQILNSIQSGESKCPSYKIQLDPPPPLFLH